MNDRPRPGGYQWRPCMRSTSRLPGQRRQQLGDLWGSAAAGLPPGRNDPSRASAHALLLLADEGLRVRHRDLRCRPAVQSSRKTFDAAGRGRPWAGDQGRRRLRAQSHPLRISTHGSVASRSSRDGSRLKTWFVSRDPKPDGGPPNNWLSLFGGGAWEFDAGTGQSYLHDSPPRPSTSTGAAEVTSRDVRRRPGSGWNGASTASGSMSRPR